MKTWKERLEHLIELGDLIGSENGPDPDYKRWAREDANREVRRYQRAHKADLKKRRPK